MYKPTNCKAFLCALVWAVILVPCAGAQSWVSLAPPPSTLTNSVAAELSDGRILLSGGYDGLSGRPSSASYLYNPSTNSWRKSSDSLIPRSGHTATRLPSGKILIIGGSVAGSDAFTRQAELFDPLTERWQAAQPINTARADHRAVSLRDGRVLVLGGIGPYGPQPTETQVFDERTGQWSASGSISAPFQVATAVLASGEVLVSGGLSTSGNSSADAALFSPATMSWRQAPPLNVPRHSHSTETLNDGRVIAVGGYTQRGPQLDAAPTEIFDPTTSRWTILTTTEPAGRGRALQRLDSGAVLAIGGFGEGDFAGLGRRDFTSPRPDVAVFDPSTLRWSPQSPLVGISGSVQLLKSGSGSVIVIGSSQNAFATNALSMQRYDAQTEPMAGTVDINWGDWGRASLLVSRSGATATAAIADATYDPRLGALILATPCLGGACLNRLDRRGQPDATFGVGGVVTVVGGAPITLKALTDSSLLLATACNSLCIDRYTAAGAADPTFGSNGRVTLDAGARWSSVRFATTADGQIIVAGVCGASPNRGWCVTVLQRSGAVDLRVAGGSIIRVSDSTVLSLDVAHVKVAGNGDILSIGKCGYKHSVAAYVVPEYFPCLVRLSATGQPLNAGPTGAIQRLPYPVGYESVLTGVALSAIEHTREMPTLSFTCASIATKSLAHCMAQFDAEGKVDLSYGNAGYTVLPSTEKCSPQPLAMADANGGAVVRSACKNDPASSGFDYQALSRVSPNGSVDTSYRGTISGPFVPDVATSAESGAVVLFGRWASTGAGGVSSQALVGYRMLGATPLSTKLMVEYHFAPLDYYFVTAKESEQKLLDTAAQWARTGLAFLVFKTDGADRLPITRYYFDRVAKSATRGSHFYTLIDSERIALNALNPANTALPAKPVNEGADGYALLPSASGQCATGTQPIYRAFRAQNRFPDDPNHRFSAARNVYDTMVALGWDGEGVAFCAPSR